MVIPPKETQVQADVRIISARALIRRGRATRPRLSFERGTAPNLRFFRIKTPEEVAAPQVRPARPTEPPSVSTILPPETPSAREIKPALAPGQTREEN